MSFTKGLILGLIIAWTLSSRAETVYASVWTFSGDNTWTPQEWRGLVESAYQILEEKSDVKIRIRSWRNRADTPCKRFFHYSKEKQFGNCLLKKTARGRAKSDKDFNLFLTPPIPAGDGVNSYVGGISTGVCQPVGGTAMIHGKRISTHVFEDGGNAGWEMTRLAIAHETGHILGAHHPEEMGRATPINIMDTDALGSLVDEYQVKIDGAYTNFREALPLVKFSKYEIKKCLKGNL